MFSYVLCFVFRVLCFVFVFCVCVSCLGFVFCVWCFGSRVFACFVFWVSCFVLVSVFDCVLDVFFIV